jgi:PTH1 family peptidyl-tRNA hydrolase
MIQFIIGLGNPGEQYSRTPHNVGRRLVELLQKKEGCRWKKGDAFDTTESVPAYVRLHTYMNVSGEAVRRLLRNTGAKPEEILICTDDFDLPLGVVRIRKKGSAGTHNGLASVVEQLETEDFPRLRLGVGPMPKGMDPARFVLSPFSEPLEKEVDAVLEKAAQAVQTAVSDGVEAAMNRFNVKVPVPNDLKKE